MTTYNGWTNYATWRVNLEMFDGYDASTFASIDELSRHLKDMAEMYIEQSAPEGLALDYAMAFISDVNWYEIANPLIEKAK
jgi:hypothetical protein